MAENPRGSGIGGQGGKVQEKRPRKKFARRLKTGILHTLPNLPEKPEICFRNGMWQVRFVAGGKTVLKESENATRKQ